MEIYPLKNADGSVITATSTATLLTALLDTASSDPNNLPTRLNAVDINAENGDIRILYDGNVPTVSKGILIKRGESACLRGIDVDKVYIIRVSTDVLVGIQVGESTNETTTFKASPPLYDHENIVLAAPTTTTVKASPGHLHSIVFNKAVNTGVVTVYDNTAGSGTKIATITTGGNARRITLLYDVAFKTGLTIVTSTSAQDITVTYR